jgi:hypothetical protein
MVKKTYFIYLFIYENQSRSMGDTCAAKVGVIAEPGIH